MLVNNEGVQYWVQHRISCNFPRGYSIQNTKPTSTSNQKRTLRIMLVHTEQWITGVDQCVLEVQITYLGYCSITVCMCVEQHPGCLILEVTMRPRVTIEMSYVGECDKCRAEWIKLLYLVLIFESCFELIRGWCSSSRLPLPLSRFEQCGNEWQEGGAWNDMRGQRVAKKWREGQVGGNEVSWEGQGGGQCIPVVWYLWYHTTMPLYTRIHTWFLWIVWNGTYGTLDSWDCNWGSGSLVEECRARSPCTFQISIEVHQLSIVGKCDSDMWWHVSLLRRHAIFPHYQS